MIVLPRLRQPRDLARINRTNPFARDLKIAINGAHPRINAVDGMGAVANNGVGTRVGMGGQGLHWSAVSNIGVKVNSTTALTNGFTGTSLGITILMLADPVASTTRYIPFSSAEGAQPELFMAFNANKAFTATSGSFSAILQGGNGATAASVVDSGLHAFVFTAANGNAAPKLYVDGVEVTSSSTGNVNGISDSGCADYVGGYSSSGFAGTGFGQYLTLAWNRELSQAEIVYLSKNPWVMFEQERLYVKTPAAASFNSAWARNSNQWVGGGFYA